MKCDTSRLGVELTMLDALPFLPGKPYLCTLCEGFPEKPPQSVVVLATLTSSQEKPSNDAAVAHRRLEHAQRVVSQDYFESGQEMQREQVRESGEGRRRGGGSALCEVIGNMSICWRCSSS